MLFGKKHTVIQVAGSDDMDVVGDTRGGTYYGEIKRNLSFNEVGELIQKCDTAICVDSYLQHHMWYLNKKAIVLWSISDPLIFGHDLHINLLKDRNFLRPNQFDLYYSNQLNPDAFVRPDEVITALTTLE